MKGFTLIEVLVSTALFSIVVVMALGALLSMSAADRRAEGLKSAVDNLNFGLDSMSRAIRTGNNYHCGISGVVTAPQNCSAGDMYFAFLSSNGVETAYQFDSSSSVCGQTGSIGCLERNLSPDGGVTWNGWQPITSPDVVITTTKLFYVVGAPSGDSIQPKVIITLTGAVSVSASQTAIFHVQSAVTQRIYDQ